jgi:hypothetical protein
MTEIVWNDASEAEWRDLLTACGRSAVEQCWGYGEASAATGFTVNRGVIVNDDDTPGGLVQAFTKRFLGVTTVTQIIRGPLWIGEPPSLETQRPILAHLRRRFTKGRLRFVYWLPEMIDTPEARRIMRTVKLRRVMTGYTSAWVDLDQSVEALEAGLSGPWRNQLRRAEKEKLSMVVSNGRQYLDALLSRHDENRKKRGFGGPNGRFIRALIEGTSDRRDAVVVTARQAKQPVAGVLMLRHSRSATYYAGWTSDEGRAVHAHNALLWRAMTHLQKDGVAWLDVGGLDTTNAAGIARFKLGLGGEVFTLAGSYL